MDIKIQALLQSLVKISVLLLFILGTFGCGNAVNIPKPQLSKPQEPSPIELSLVNIPVSMNLKSVINFLEKEVPAEIAADSAWTDTGQRKLGIAIGSKFHVWRDRSEERRVG